MAKRAAVQAAQEKPTTSMLAIISLVAGLMGLTGYPVLPSIAAIITGMMAKQEIERSEGKLSGRELALAGQILGWLGVLLGVLILCALCGFFFFILAMVDGGGMQQDLLRGLPALVAALA